MSPQITPPLYPPPSMEKLRSKPIITKSSNISLNDNAVLERRRRPLLSLHPSYPLIP